MLAPAIMRTSGGRLQELLRIKPRSFFLKSRGDFEGYRMLSIFSSHDHFDMICSVHVWALFTEEVVEH